MAKLNRSSETFMLRLKKALSRGLRVAGIRADIAVEAVPHTKLHRALVLAKEFKNLNPSERQDLVWRIVGSQFTADEQLQISMIVTLATDEAIRTDRKVPGRGRAEPGRALMLEGERPRKRQTRRRAGPGLGLLSDT